MTRPQPYRSVEWIGDQNGHLRLLDQTLLPSELVYLDCHTVDTVWEAIRSLRVRGAPAIGITAAYGLLVALRNVDNADREAFLNRFYEAQAYLASSRPTAVNLFWALERMKRCYEVLKSAPVTEIRQKLLKEAHDIYLEDREMSHAIGRHGAELLQGKRIFLTHCNTGGLATAEYGTALSIFFTLQDQGHSVHIFVDETRPLFQGARLTTWELMQRGINATLICDSMAAHVIRDKNVEAIVTGADRIAANGDSANKIGTYSLAVLAQFHQVPFYIAAPSSTFDLSMESGADIEIEERHATEVTTPFGSPKPVAPSDVLVYNPAFDVTPARLITGIITERGVIAPVNELAIRECLQ